MNIIFLLPLIVLLSIIFFHRKSFHLKSKQVMFLYFICSVILEVFAIVYYLVNFTYSHISILFFWIIALLASIHFLLKLNNSFTTKQSLNHLKELRFIDKDEIDVKGLTEYLFNNKIATTSSNTFPSIFNSFDALLSYQEVAEPIQWIEKYKNKKSMAHLLPLYFLIVQEDSFQSNLLADHLEENGYEFLTKDFKTNRYSFEKLNRRSFDNSFSKVKLQKFTAEQQKAIVALKSFVK